jgi:hypothetical protein
VLLPRVTFGRPGLLRITVYCQLLSLCALSAVSSPSRPALTGAFPRIAAKIRDANLTGVNSSPVRFVRPDLIFA